MPFGEEFHPGLTGPFSILEFDALRPIVFVDHHRGSAYLYDEDQVAEYRKAAKLMANLALSEQQTSSLLREVIAQLEA